MRTGPAPVKDRMMRALRVEASSSAMTLAILSSTSLSFAAMSCRQGVGKRFQARLADMLEAVADLAGKLEQHGPHIEEFAQFTGLLGPAGEPLVGKVLAVEGDQPGVDRVGLGQHADRFGKGADTGGVEQLDDETIGLQGFDDDAFVVAAGFQGDLLDAGLAQPASKAGQAARVAVDHEGLIARQDMNVELVLADIDAGDDYHLAHLRDPFLAFGLVTMQPCGLCEETIRAPSFAAGSAKAASMDLIGLRTVGAGGRCRSPRVSSLSGASPATCKDLTPATRPVSDRSARSFRRVRSVAARLRSSQFITHTVGRRVKPWGRISRSTGSTSISSTLASEGPRRQASIISPTAASSPTISASTAPSRRLRTQPARPRRRPVADRPVAIADALHPTGDGEAGLQRHRLTRTR